MKYLQDYQEQRQTELFTRLGTFFCFSGKQFKEGRKEGVKYSNMGSGMVTPDGTEIELIESLDTIYKESIEQDMKENGKDGIIKRELANHEAYYTGSIESTVEALEGYSITDEEILKVYRAERNQLIEQDKF